MKDNYRRGGRWTRISKAQKWQSRLQGARLQTMHSIESAWHYLSLVERFTTDRGKILDIGTGKDLPVNSKVKSYKSKVKYSEIKGVKIWGYDLVEPRKEFSVTQYLNFANKIITRIQKSNKLPILVGGTGLYIKAVVDGIPTAFVPRNARLRKNLVAKSVDELFEILAQLDPFKAGSMNSSDKKNSRRLVRAIEIAQWKLENHKTPEVRSYRTPGVGQIFFVGLTAPQDILDQLIVKRVNARVESGIEKEIQDLLAKKINWNHQSMSSLGYREWKDFFTGVKTRKEVIDQWKSDEKKYARRQLTWFKKDKRINWFDLSDKNWQKEVEKLVGKWYSKSE